MIPAEVEYLSVKQVASMLHTTRQTVASWLRSGRLKGQKFGKFWRIKRGDLDAFGWEGAGR